MNRMKHCCVKDAVHMCDNICYEAGLCVRLGPVVVHDMQSFAIDVQMMRKEGYVCIMHGATEMQSRRLHQ